MEGTRIGPYRVLGDLGSGGMGKVYLAEVEGKAPGLHDGTRVALKVIHPHLLETPGFFKRFLREAEIGRNDPRISRLLRAGPCRNRHRGARITARSRSRKGKSTHLRRLERSL